jgi:hypothetical protein
MDKVNAIFSNSEERATFIDNPHNTINIGRDLLRQIREGPYLKEVEWAVRKGYSRKDETAELRIFALQLFNLTQHPIVERL